MPTLVVPRLVALPAQVAALVPVAGLVGREPVFSLLQRLQMRAARETDEAVRGAVADVICAVMEEGGVGMLTAGQAASMARDVARLRLPPAEAPDTSAAPDSRAAAETGEAAVTAAAVWAVLRSNAALLPASPAAMVPLTRAVAAYCEAARLTPADDRQNALIVAELRRLVGRVVAKALHTPKVMGSIAARRRQTRAVGGAPWTAAAEAADAEAVLARVTMPAVLAFGSTTNAFGLHGSDVDVCVLTPPDLDALVSPPDVFRAVTKPLRYPSAAIVLVQAIPWARVPLIKAEHRPSGTAVDIGLNNGLGVHNSTLLRTYAALDARVQPFVLGVKRWAKARGVNDASSGTPSSYTHTLLALFYLQQLRVLPSLQDPALIAAVAAQPGGAGALTTTPAITDWDSTFVSDAPRAAAWWRSVAPAVPAASVGELLAGYFLYFARCERLLSHVASVRTGTWRPRGEVACRGGKAARRWCLSVEDPFESARDLGGVVLPPGMYCLVTEWSRAAAALHGPAGPATFDEVCAPLAALPAARAVNADMKRVGASAPCPPLPPPTAVPPAAGFIDAASTVRSVAATAAAAVAAGGGGAAAAAPPIMHFVARHT